jgi:hypothetical protein
MSDNLDVGAWIGIVSLVLAIPVGVLSHLIAERIKGTLAKRKLVKTDQTRQQAIRAYNTIKAFHDRTRDRYAYYLIVVGWAAIFAVASGTTVILLFVLHPNFHFVEPDPQLPPDIGVVFLFVMAILFALLSVIFMVSTYNVSRHLEHFDAYKKEMEDRWGPMDTGDTSA